MPAQPLAFNLSLDDHDDDTATRSLEDNDSRLMEMLAAQAAHREDRSVVENEELIAGDKKLSDVEKKAILQKSLHNAASNGDVEQVGRLLHGHARQHVDINGPDEEGTAPIIYASCFVSS
jgi:phage-related minor tail protein